MDYEDWDLKWFKRANVKPLTRKEKNDLTKKKYQYLKITKSIRIKISDLERKIENAKPSIKNAEYTHSKCGIKAAIYFGRTPQGGELGGEDLAYCLYCQEKYLRE